MWGWVMHSDSDLGKKTTRGARAIRRRTCQGLAMGILTVLVSAALPRGAAVAGAPMAEAVVAAIGYEPILLTEVLAYQQIVSEPITLRAAVEQLVDERLLAQEARRYGLESESGLPPVKIPGAEPGSPEAKAAQRFIRDRALAVQFLKFRFGEFVPVTREEIADYMRTHPETSGLELAQRERIARERLLPIVRARREAAFKAELRIRSEVRFMVEQILKDQALSSR